MAITISDVREKYPQYNDMSDKDLADSLHKKFYSDMSTDQFYSKVGFGPQIPGSNDVAPPKQPDSAATQVKKLAGAVIETPLSMATGFAGNVAGNVVGSTLEANNYVADKLGIPGGRVNPTAVKRKIEEAVTYKPKTEGGEIAGEVLGKAADVTIGEHGAGGLLKKGAKKLGGSEYVQEFAGDIPMLATPGLLRGVKTLPKAIPEIASKSGEFLKKTSGLTDAQLETKAPRMFEKSLTETAETRYNKGDIDKEQYQSSLDAAKKVGDMSLEEAREFLRGPEGAKLIKEVTPGIWTSMWESAVKGGSYPIRALDKVGGPGAGMAAAAVLGYVSPHYVAGALGIGAVTGVAKGLSTRASLKKLVSEPKQAEPPTSTPPPEPPPPDVPPAGPSTPPPGPMKLDPGTVNRLKKRIEDVPDQAPLNLNTEPTRKTGDMPLILRDQPDRPQGMAAGMKAQQLSTAEVIKSRIEEMQGAPKKTAKDFGVTNVQFARAVELRANDRANIKMAKTREPGDFSNTSNELLDAQYRAASVAGDKARMNRIGDEQRRRIDHPDFLKWNSNEMYGPDYVKNDKGVGSYKRMTLDEAIEKIKAEDDAAAGETTMSAEQIRNLSKKRGSGSMSFGEMPETDYGAAGDRMWSTLKRDVVKATEALRDPNVSGTPDSIVKKHGFDDFNDYKAAKDKLGKQHPLNIGSSGKSGTMAMSSGRPVDVTAKIMKGKDAELYTHPEKIRGWEFRIYQKDEKIIIQSRSGPGSHWKDTRDRSYTSYKDAQESLDLKIKMSKMTKEELARALKDMKW